MGTASKTVGAILSAVERRKLAGETLCDERTILRWERGDAIRGSTRKALDDAARRLDLPVPSAPKPKKRAA